MAGAAKYKYRGDVDGLRAVAVIAVILNHFYPALMPSGYLGVDVFFVISGYVITQSLVSMKSQGWFDYLTAFYANRVRRLLPALIFCVALTTVLFLVLTPGPQREIFVTGGLSLFGLSNLYLLKIASNYFSIDAHLNPFTHTWSLGVEEQFYFIYPALLALTGLALVKVERAWARTTLLLVVLSAASLLSYLFLVKSHPVFSFYSMPTRFWEFCFGAFAFIFINKYWLNGKSIRWGGGLLWLSFLGLLGLFFVPIEYQACSTVLAVLLVTILIVFSVPSLGVHQLLCSPPFLYIGALSYSLYLWHWSILVLGRYTVGDSLVASFFLLVIVFAFSLFSYYFVERPMRYKGYLSGRVRPLCLVILIVLPLSYLIVREVPKARVENLSVASLMGIEAAASWAGTIKCHGDNQAENDEVFLSDCLRPVRTVERPHTVFLLGDSHAAQFTFMLEKALQGMPYSLRFAHNASDYDFPRSFLSGKAVAPTLDYVVETARKGDVVAVAMHRGRLNPNRDGHVDMSHPVELDKHAVFFEENLSVYIEKLAASGVKVVLIKDTPLMSVVAASEACKLQLQIFGRSVCRVSKAQDLHTRKRLDLVYQGLLEKNKAVFTWDPFDFMYSADGYADVVDDVNEYVMMDSHHITQYQSEKMAQEFTLFFKGVVR